MLAIERQHRILDMLLESEAVSTGKVARVLDISEETVRRDFEKLEGDGQLARKHGGAVRINDSRRDLSLNSRELANVAEKEAIARAALSQIQAGDTIFFDASSTVFHLACLLPNLEATVLTNALKTAIELTRRSAIQVILVGGVVSHRSLSAQGALADQMLEYYHVQKAFMSCRGLDAERGLSEANVEQAGLKRKIARMADHIIVLADHTKMGLKSSYFFARLEEIDLLITDRLPEKSVKQTLRKGAGKLMLPGENPI
jgi:DeoR family fructose operon transcriptional repressor